MTCLPINKFSLFFFFTFFLFCLGSKIAKGQKTQEGYGVELNMLGGRIFKHTARFKGPIPSFSYATDINFVWKTNGKAPWQQRRHYPTIGLGITYTYYDRDFYGQSLGVYPNLELPILRRKKVEWTTRFGMGLGYISKHYSPYGPNWDTLNNAIGAHINNFSLLSSDIRFHINKHWDVQGGVSFTHMSSAKFRLPNLGINYLGGHIGLRYFPVTSQPTKLSNNLKPLHNRYLLHFRQGIAMSTGESIGSAATPVYLSSLFISKRYWGKNKIFIGIDYSYHQSIYDFERIQGLNLGDEKKHAWKSGFFLGHEFLYGSVGLHFQLGAYIHQAILGSAPIYQKLGLNWYLIQKENGLVKELTISTLLKTHYATAELAELGIGLGF